MSDAAWPRIAADPGLSAVYEALLAAVRARGPVTVHYRKSAVQLIRPDGAGVLSVHPDRDGLAVTLIVDGPVASSRISSSQQLSPGVWHHRLRLGSAADVDDELGGWLATAYRR